MKAYIRKVQYYETDMMGVTHHANYIHWMEEARVDFMDQLGFPYTRMEAEGVSSPVIAVSCEYKKPCTFGDEITVTVTVKSFSNVRLAIAYEMQKSERGNRVSGKFRTYLSEPRRPHCKHQTHNAGILQSR